MRTDFYFFSQKIKWHFGEISLMSWCTTLIYRAQFIDNLELKSFWISKIVFEFSHALSSPICQHLTSLRVFCYKVTKKFTKVLSKFSRKPIYKKAKSSIIFSAKILNQRLKSIRKFQVWAIFRNGKLFNVVFYWKLNALRQRVNKYDPYILLC